VLSCEKGQEWVNLISPFESCGQSNVLGSSREVDPRLLLRWIYRREAMISKTCQLETSAIPVRLGTHDTGSVNQ
jgi:hypothetical protein